MILFWAHTGLDDDYAAYRHRLRRHYYYDITTTRSHTITGYTMWACQLNLSLIALERPHGRLSPSVKASLRDRPIDRDRSDGHRQEQKAMRKAVRRTAFGEAAHTAAEIDKIL